MKLLKLVYLAHGWNLGIRGQSLITQTAEAWKYGPVIPSVYNAFKTYGDSPIKSICEIQTVKEIDEETSKLLDKVYDIYKDYNGLQLSTITHMANSPWDIVWNQQGGKDVFSVPIPNDLIEKYYKDKINESKANKA